MLWFLSILMIEVNAWCSLRNRMQPFLFTSVQLVTYPIQMSDLLPFNHFLTPLQSPNLLPFNRIFIHSQMSNLLPFNPFLTHLQSSDLSSKAQYLTLTNDPLTPYNRLTCPPSNALLIPYKPWPYSRSIDCLSRNNVRLIPLQFHTKVQIYPH